MSSPGYFNVHKYSTVSAAGSTATDTNYVSPADVLAGLQHMVVSFLHVPTGRSVFFKAFITSLVESYNSDWTEESVYGRTDPIQMFKQTTRRIDLGLKVPAETVGEAYDNLARVGTLTQFLYPNYDSVGTADTITQGPVLRMKVMNLIRKSPSLVSDGVDGADGAVASPSGSLDAYASSVDANRGLMGIITSLNIAHNLENNDIGIIQHKENTIFSTMIDVNLSFTVLHEEVLGWDKDGSFATPGFPYGAVTMTPEDADEAYKKLSSARAPKVSADDDLNEQAIMLAKKRYLTMGGKARLKKDLQWIASVNEKKTELAKLKASNGDADKIAKLEKQIASSQGNYDYISTTLEGAGSWDKADVSETTLGNMSGADAKETGKSAGDWIDALVDS